MRYLTVSSFGTALGLSGERLVVHEADGRTWETALSRLRTIRIEKKRYQCLHESDARLCSEGHSIVPR